MTTHAEHEHGHGADDHGHGHDGHELAYETIPEGSTQDSFLIWLAVVGLVGWLLFGWTMMTAPKHEVAEAGHSTSEGAPAHE